MILDIISTIIPMVMIIIPIIGAIYLITHIDVYRGKTTLEITYRDSVAVDSIVVFKVR